LAYELVALRDIDEREALFLDYEPAWESAWDANVQRWEEQQQYGRMYIQGSERIKDFRLELVSENQ